MLRRSAPLALTLALILTATSASALPISLVGGPLVAPDSGPFAGFTATLAPGADTANASLTFIVSSPNGTNASYQIGEPSLVMGPLGATCDPGCNFIGTTPLGNFLVPTGGPGAAWVADLLYVNPLAGALTGDSFALSFNDYTALVSTNGGLLVVVPEPAISGLFLLGLGGMAAARRRQLI